MNLGLEFNDCSQYYIKIFNNKLKDIMWATDKNTKMMNQLEMEKN